jgi:protein-L-isoaspartate(D-aspartate) O-methyltransferase
MLRPPSPTSTICEPGVSAARAARGQYWPVDAAEFTALRDRLVAELVGQGRIASRAVEHAFRVVPRHAFLPGVDPRLAYADEAVVTDRDAAGRPISSSSQPSIMALMLDQLGLQPGQRVLEIGAGTGYNAALLAELVGAAGSVVTVDIDVELVRRARHNLELAGYGQVGVAHGDGAQGWPARAPYDRIILTVGAWDLAPSWIQQLADGGRLLVPLSVRGAQRSVAFEQMDGALASVSIIDCGFMPMRGALAGPASARPLARPGIFLHLDDDRRIDPGAFAAALELPGGQRATGVQVTTAEIMGGLDLWLSLQEPDTARLIALDSAVRSGIVPALVSFPGMSSTIALVGQRCLATLVRRDDGGDDRPFELDVRGYGPDSDTLVGRLVAYVRAWARHGRPSSARLSIRAYPRDQAPADLPGSIIVDKPRTRLVVDWT